MTSRIKYRLHWRSGTTYGRGPATWVHKADAELRASVLNRRYPGTRHWVAPTVMPRRAA